MYIVKGQGDSSDVLGLSIKLRILLKIETPSSTLYCPFSYGLEIIFSAIKFKIKNRIYSEHVLLRKGPLRGIEEGERKQCGVRGSFHHILTTFGHHSLHISTPLRLFNLSTLVGHSILLFI
jgi:hypothetical protein